MRKLLIWAHYFQWMLMMAAKTLEFAASYFPSILTAIRKIQQKIQGLTKGETAEESLEKDIPKRHSKGKSKKTRMKDNKKCLHNIGKYNVVPDPENIDPEYLDPASGGKGTSSHLEDNCSMKEVPSNGLSDTNSIVHKSRPPERVKKRISMSWYARRAVVTVFLLVCGASAKSFQNKSSEVGQSVSMKIQEDIAGDFPFFIQYIPNNNSSEVLTLCTYSNGSLSMPNPNNSHLQGISCLPKGVFISSAKLHHAGTFSIIIICNETDCPRSLIYNLSITGKDEPLIRPIVTAENGTTSNRTDVGGGGGSNNMNIIWTVIPTLAILVTIVILVVICINPDLRNRVLNMFPWKKSPTSSNDADTVDSVHYRMIPGPPRESAEIY